jgi:hypothetical protein
MKTLKRYNQFINEADETDIDLGDTESKDVEKKETTVDFSDLKEEVSSLIEKSLKTSDSQTKEDFIQAFIKEPEETQIEGLINDSDVYEFYLKYRNEIDEMLSDINFYDEVPSEIGSFSLYDYIIKGTNKAILEIVHKIQEEGSSSETTEEIEEPTESSEGE